MRGVARAAGGGFGGSFRGRGAGGAIRVGGGGGGLLGGLVKGGGGGGLLGGLARVAPLIGGVAAAGMAAVGVASLFKQRQQKVEIKAAPPQQPIIMPAPQTIIIQGAPGPPGAPGQKFHS